MTHPPRPPQPGNGSSGPQAATQERWTVGRLLNWTVGYFEAKGVEFPRLDAEVLLADALGCQRIELYVNFDQPVTADERARFREYVRRRAAGEPVAYIVGRKEFFGLEFAVGPDVLIPRPDSEFVVMTYLEHFRAREHTLVIDVGTGSGNLAVAIAHEHPGARVIATDVSLAALSVAARNARRHGVADRIRLVRSDLLHAVRPSEFADAIVSNPPYIPSDQVNQLEPGVRDYEPHVALDGGPSGLDVVARLIEQAVTRLKLGGLLILEIGADQEQPVRKLMLDTGRMDVLPTVHDYDRHPRVVVGRRDV